MCVQIVPPPYSFALGNDFEWNAIFALTRSLVRHTAHLRKSCELFMHVCVLSYLLHSPRIYARVLYVFVKRLFIVHHLKYLNIWPEGVSPGKFLVGQFSSLLVLLMLSL